MPVLFYSLTQTNKFITQLRDLPEREREHVLEKIELLQQNPAPDAKNKKRLKGYDDPIYRIRAGDYRITYGFDQSQGWVKLLGVAHRSRVYDDIWTDDDDIVETGQTHVQVPPEPARSVTRRRPGSWSVPPERLDLPRIPDNAALERIGVAQEHWAALRRCQTVDDLIAADVPETVRCKVFDAITDAGYDRELRGPSYLINSIDDLRRFLAGDLVTFLLQLDPEQERFVEWSGRGPVLLKGAPGTGKSIVAIYRVRSLLQTLRRAGAAEPRILFTTYTNALVNSSRQLLQQLLGDDARFVEVRTADDVVAAVLDAVGERVRPYDDGESSALVERARRRIAAGSPEDQAHARSIEALTKEYLREEIDTVIVGREHATLDDYLGDRRSGRRVPLTQAQRSAVWRVHLERERSMAGASRRTQAQRRRRAAELVRTGIWAAHYDGVVIDEAQDLSPSVIRMLVGVCKSLDRLMLAADPNQCIFGNGFRWQDVHADLKFRGRTSVLHRNYRSTAEISAAARAYLAGAALDEQADGDDDLEHVRGGARPGLCRVPNRVAEVDGIDAFIRVATRAHHVGLGSCAVLVPGSAGGSWIAEQLTERGLRATFQASKQVDLQRPEVKVLTFQSAKGLEFPVVAIAARGCNPTGRLASDAPVEEVEEALLLQRRQLYVAMTRSTLELLVLLPDGEPTPPLDGLGEPHWDTSPFAAPAESAPATLARTG